MAKEKTPMKLINIATNVLNEQSDSTILKIQTALKSAGYDIGTSGPNKDGLDGIYGNFTKNAIIAFQKANGIQPTGFVGVKTAPKLGTPQMTPYTATQPSSLQSKITSAGQNIKSRISSTMGDVKSTINSKPVAKPEVNPVAKPEVNPVAKPEVKPVIKPEEKKSEGIISFLRKISPNLTQMFFTKPLTGDDFTRNQKQVVYNAIQNAIKRGQRKDRGMTTYADYNKEVYEMLDTVKGSASLDTMTSLKKSVSDPYFQVATTMGKFKYQLQPNGAYLASDTYDFSKWNAFTVKKEELKGMSYPQQIAYVKTKDKLSTYHAAREIAYLEHPDSAPEETKTKINVIVDPKEFGRRASA